METTAASADLRCMDWSALPADLLHQVSRRLHDPLDFLRLRAVCRSWRSAAASPPPFLPWLLGLPTTTSTSSTTGDLSLPFFSLSSGAPRSIPAPSPAHRLLGHTHSHLLFSHPRHPPNDDHHPLLLVNPLTGAQIPLPPAPFPASYPISQGYLSGPAFPVVLYNSMKLCFHHHHHHHPDVESGNPGAVAGWTEVPVTGGLVAENMYHDGKVFVCNDCGHITIFDAVTLAVVGAVPPPPPPGATPIRGAFRCIAFVPSGDELLGVVRYISDGQNPPEDRGGIQVHRLEFAAEAPSPRWVQMRSIGDRMLFVGLYQGFSFNAADFAGFAGNCIYFFKFEKAKRSCVYRFSLEDGRTEELPVPWRHACTWFVPSLS